MVPRLNFLFICASSRQAGWLQLHEAGMALYERGARPIRAREGIWQLPNGQIIQFASVQDEIWRTLNRVQDKGDVLLLYEDDQVDEESRWYVEELLRSLEVERNIKITSLRQSYRQLESWRTYAIDIVIPIEAQDTQPLPLPGPIIYR